MCELYDELAKAFPSKWGRGSPLGNHGEQFRKDFEAAFSDVIQKKAPFTLDSLSLLESQRQLAKYFSRFVLDSTGRDNYSILLRSLRKSERNHNSLFGALNYDCLFEQAAYRLGLQVDYSCSDINPSTIHVAKVHGSCNFITEISGYGSALLSSPGVHLEVPLTCLPPVEVEKMLVEKFSRMDPVCLPVMNQISPGKEQLVAHAKIQGFRNKWRESASEARPRAVVIIGVSYNPHDIHILEAIEKICVPLFYIGGKEDFEEWHLRNAHFRHVAKTFEEGVEPLLSQLENLPVADLPT